MLSTDKEMRGALKAKPGFEKKHAAIIAQMTDGN